MPKRIDAYRAQRMIKRTRSKDGALLFDVLPPSIFVQEHLPGAVNLPLETLDRAAIANYDLARAIVVYCFDQH